MIRSTAERLASLRRSNKKMSACLEQILVEIKDETVKSKIESALDDNCLNDGNAEQMVKLPADLL